MSVWRTSSKRPATWRHRRAALRDGGCGSSPLEASWSWESLLSADVGLRGIEDVRGNRPRTSHHQLDDRAAVRALMQAYQPGDVLMTTKLALPALWWYAGIPAARPGLNGNRQTDGSPILRVEYMPPGPGCPRGSRRKYTSTRRRPSNRCPYIVARAAWTWWHVLDTKDWTAIRLAISVQSRTRGRNSRVPPDVPVRASFVVISTSPG